MSDPNTTTTAEPQFNTLWSPDYTALDYGPMRDEVKDYIQTRYESEGIQDDFLQSSAAMVFIDAISYIGHLVAQRAEDLVGEVWLPSVQLRKNLLKLVNLFGQTPKLPRAASVNVNILAQTSPLATITLPRLFSVPIQGLDGKNYNFELMAEKNDYYTRVVLPAGVRTQVAAFYAGTSYQDVFQSSGATRQSYQISRSPIIEGSVYVSVHPKPPSLITPDEIVASRIIEVPSLVTPLDQMVYKLEVLENNRVIVHFAIDRFGQVPPRGWYVYIDHRIGGGKVTNVTVGVLNKTYPLRDDLGNEIRLIFTNSNSRGIGGDDQESVDEIKERIPARVRSTDRFSQREDYPSLLKEALPNEIEEVFALDYQTDRRLNNGVAVHVPQNGVFLWVLPTSGGDLDDDQRQIIASTLEEKNLIAIEHYLFSPDFNDWTVQAEIFYSRKTDPVDLEERIRARLLQEYSAYTIDGQPTGNLRFMRVIHVSQVSSLIQSEIGIVGYVILHTPSIDIDPYHTSPPSFGQVPRLDPDNIILTMTLMEGDE